MFNLLPLRPQDIQALMRGLAANPLLAALFLISPPDALRYMGFGMFAVLFDSLRPTSQGDIARVEQVVQALNQGRTTLEEVQIIQLAAPVEETLSQPVEGGLVEGILPQPVEESLTAFERSDVQLTVSKATLQRVLALYTQYTFNGQTFTMPTQRWGDVTAIGKTLSLELAPGQARIVATFEGATLLRMPLPLSRSVELGTLNSPIVLDVLTTVSFDQNDLLTLDIRQGEIRLTRVPLPEMVARELVRQLIAAVPTIPLVKMPTHFELPDARDDNTGVIAFKARGVRIGADGVWLEFHLDSGDL